MVTCKRCNGTRKVLADLKSVGFGSGFMAFMSAGTKPCYNDDGSVHHEIVCPECDGENPVVNLHTKSRRIERALIGTDIRGIPIVLATDGGSVACYCEEFSSDAEDIGICNKNLEPGLWLWTGYASMEYETWESFTPTELVFTGEMRRVDPSEIAELYAMNPPQEDDEHG